MPLVLTWESTVNLAVLEHQEKPHCQRMDEATIRDLRTRLRELRKITGWSQEQVAELAKLDYKFYQSIEAGRRKQLRVSTLERIAKPYGLEAYHLLAPEMPISQPLAAVMSESKTKYLSRYSRKRKSKLK